jgi:hypothetical protein
MQIKIDLQTISSSIQYMIEALQMGYMKICHLYKTKEIFKFKEICATEKIHGTSTWVYLKNDTLHFHCGGETQKTFEPLFDKDFLLSELLTIAKENGWQSIKVHGEAYGGKQQAMSKTYGNQLKFIAFDIRVDMDLSTDKFLDILDAEVMSKRLGLEFVAYEIGPPTVEFLEEQMMKCSVQAIRNGCGDDKQREGLVLRPVKEGILSDGTRAICKHLNPNFRETTTERSLLGDKLKIYAENQEVADEWVTENRLNHVVSKFLHDKPDDKKMIEKSDIGKLVTRVLEDIKIEAGNEIVWSEAVDKAVRGRSGALINNLMRTGKI